MRRFSDQCCTYIPWTGAFVILENIQYAVMDKSCVSKKVSPFSVFVDRGAVSSPMCRAVGCSVPRSRSTAGQDTAPDLRTLGALYDTGN